MRLGWSAQLLIDNWTDHAPTEDAGAVALAPGWHPIRLEYYERGFGALIRLAHAPPGAPAQPVPAGRLSPPPGVNRPPVASINSPSSTRGRK